MQITGLYTTSGKFYRMDDPIDVTEESGRLVDSGGYVRAVRDEHGEWLNASLLKAGIESNVKVIQ